MKLLVVLLAGLITGCATVNQKPVFHFSSPEQQQRWQTHQLSLAAIEDNWRFAGRIGASTQDDAWSGSIWWQQAQSRFQIELAGPLQQGTIRLSGDANSATVQVAEGESYSGSDAATLLQRYTGWSIPFDSLRYWVLGLPRPMGDVQQVQLGPNGKISNINNGYWRVNFSRYQKVRSVELPRKIVLQHADAKIRLVFDQWAYDG